MQREMTRLFQLYLPPQAVQDKKVWRDQQVLGCNTPSFKWVKRTKHSCRQPQAKKCQGSKHDVEWSKRAVSTGSSPKNAPRVHPTPFFERVAKSRGSSLLANVLKWEFTKSQSSEDKFVDKSSRRRRTMLSISFPCIFQLLSNGSI